MTEYFWTDGSALGQVEIGEPRTERTESAIKYLRYRLRTLDKLESAGLLDNTVPECEHTPPCDQGNDESPCLTRVGRSDD